MWNEQHNRKPEKRTVGVYSRRFKIDDYSVFNTNIKW